MQTQLSSLQVCVPCSPVTWLVLGWYCTMRLAAGKSVQGFSGIQVQRCICLQVYFCRPKRNPKRAGLELSCGGVRELAPMITAGHWYRDCDDEASPSNPSPAKRLHSPPHKDTLPHRGAPSWGSQQDPGGQDLPSPLKFCHACCEARTVLGKRTALGRDEGPRAHGPGG